MHAGGQIGVLVEGELETDFVARNDKFQEFAREVALHVAAAAPLYVSEKDIPEEDREREMRIFREQAAADGKPRRSSRRSPRAGCKWLEEVVLLNQKHVNEEKHETKTIEELQAEVTVATNENVVIRRFVRFQVGEVAAVAERTAGVPPRPPQALRRGAHGRLRVRRRPGTDLSDRQGCEGCLGARGGGGDRGRRRQYLPRAPGRRGGHGPRDGRLHGDARHCAQRPRLQDALEKLGADTRVQSAITISEVASRISAAVRSATWRRADRDLRRRHRQPVLHHRHRRGPAGLEIHAEAMLMAKNHVEGVYSADPRENPDAEFIEVITARRSAQAEHNGLHGAVAVHGQRPADLRLQHGRRAEYRPDSVRRAGGNARKHLMADEDLIQDFLDEAGTRMTKSVEATRNELATVRTGRASPHLLDRIQVDYYGAITALEAARTGLGHGGAAPDRHALRQELDQGDREGDHGVGRGADAVERRQRDQADRSPS